VEDGQSLTFPSAAFDIIVTIDVIEHVDDAMALLREIVRVLKPGGTLIITGPHDHFPISYDPINYVLGKVGRRHFGIGAYGYGHTWLVDGAQLQGWLRDVGLSTIETHLLTKALAASVECYWGGLVQRILKANAANKAGTRTRGVRLRPRSDPPLLWVTDVLNRLDASLLAGAGDSVGIAMIAEKARG
jgi:predicted SAM-dependent methyltransferase